MKKLLNIKSRLDKLSSQVASDDWKNFDRFTMEVNQSNYSGTIKRGKDGKWMLYDIDGNPESSESFNDLDSLMDYYDINKSHLSGDYVKNILN